MKRQPMERIKSLNWGKITAAFVLLSLILSVIFIILQLVEASSGSQPPEAHEKLKSDYTLMLLQCLLGIAALFLPSFLSRQFRFEFPQKTYMAYVLFLYCAIYLGEVRSFYYRIFFWDTILHAFSGAMLGALGFFVVRLLNEHERVNVHLSPLFVALFAFFFALSMGTLWEIYEFAADRLLGLNMQKFMTDDGTQLVGHHALTDTMKDLIVDALAALVVSVMGFISQTRELKRKQAEDMPVEMEIQAEVLEQPEPAQEEYVCRS